MVPAPAVVGALADVAAGGGELGVVAVDAIVVVAPVGCAGA